MTGTRAVRITWGIVPAITYSTSLQSVSIIIRKPFTVSFRRSARTFVARWGQVERSMTALWAEEFGVGAEKPIVVVHVPCTRYCCGCGHTSVAPVFAHSRMLSDQPYLYMCI